MRARLARSYRPCPASGLHVRVELGRIAFGGEHPGVLIPLVITPPHQVMEPGFTSGTVGHASGWYRHDTPLSSNWRMRAHPPDGQCGGYQL